MICIGLFRFDNHAQVAEVGVDCVATGLEYWPTRSDKTSEAFALRDEAEEEARQPCVHFSIDLRSLHTTDKTYGVQSKL